MFEDTVKALRILIVALVAALCALIVIFAEDSTKDPKPESCAPQKLKGQS